MQYERYECSPATKCHSPTIPLVHSKDLATICRTFAYFSAYLCGNSAGSDSLCGSSAYNPHTRHTLHLTQRRETATMGMMMLLPRMMVMMMMILLLLMLTICCCCMPQKCLIKLMKCILWFLATVQPESNHLAHNDVNLMLTVASPMTVAYWKLFASLLMTQSDTCTRTTSCFQTLYKLQLLWCHFCQMANNVEMEM